MGVLVKNGKSYTGTGNLLIQPVIYSDDERCIGVWRDGKPLYRKTISGRTPSSSYDYFGDEIENFEHCYYYEGVLIPDDANSSVNSIFYNRPDNNNAEYYIVIESTGKVFIRTYTSQASTFYITIFYTKTTDTAGTAAWVPTGATPIHYSLNEQVIGTWIDGKPLYGRVIYRDDLSIKYSSSEDDKKIDIGSTTNVVRYSGYCMYNSSGSKLPLPSYTERGTTLNSDIGSRILPDGKIMIQPGQDYSSDTYSIKIVCLILEYTKTTD